MMALSSIHRSRECWESELCLTQKDIALARRGSCFPTSSQTDDVRRNSCLPRIVQQSYRTKGKSIELAGAGGERTRTDSIASQNETNDDVIIINVSGKKFETYVNTLQRFPNTLLGDPTKLLTYYNHITGEYFFDRHRKAFNGILYFYQSNGIVEKPLGVSESLFTQEALFFGLSHSALQYEESIQSDGPEFQLPSNPYLCKIWVLFEHPNSSLGAKILAVFSICIVVVSIVVFCVESIPAVNPEKPEGEHMYKTWMIINSICNTWFTIEYVLRLISAPGKILFLRSTINIIDLVSILPFYISIFIGQGAESRGGGLKVLKVIRIFRVTKIFKLTRHSRGLYVLAKSIKSSQHEISMLVLFMAIGIILFSSAMYYAESPQNDKFKSIPACFWWAVVTMTTVGYGDLYPTTILGKFIGAICAVSGVLVIALPVPVFVSNFEHCYKQERNRQERENEMTKKLKATRENEKENTFKMIADTSIMFGEPMNGETLEVPDIIDPSLQPQVTTESVSFGDSPVMTRSTHSDSTLLPLSPSSSKQVETKASTSKDPRASLLTVGNGHVHRTGSDSKN